MSSIPKPISMPSFHTELAQLIHASRHHLRKHHRPCYRKHMPAPPEKEKQTLPQTLAPKQSKCKPISLEPLQAPKASLPTSILADLGLPIHDQPPSDQKARHLCERWKNRTLTGAIAVLIGPEKELERKFLYNIARAIDTLIAPCRAIEIKKLENTWDQFLTEPQLQHIIAHDAALTGNLLSELRAVPAENSHHLGTKPLLLLPDLTLYLKDPLLKASLWKMLCAVLRPSS